MLPPRSLTTTLAPCAASVSACSRPMPRPAPVTMATRPSHRPMTFLLDRRRRRPVPGRRVILRVARPATPIRRKDVDRPVASRRCSTPTSSSSAAGPPARRRRSRWPAPGATCVLVDKATLPARQVLRRRADGRRAAAARGSSASTRRPSPSWQPVDDVVVRSPSGREVTLPAARRRRAVRGGRPPRRARRRAARRGPAAPAPRCTTATRCVGGAASATTASSLDVEGVGHGRAPATSSPPTACGRRCASTLGLADAGLPRRVARLPPVLHRRRPAGGRAPVRVVRARPAARLRLVVPAARRPGQRRLRRSSATAGGRASRT